jgi:hypothetical protein
VAKYFGGYLAGENADGWDKPILPNINQIFINYRKAECLII